MTSQKDESYWLGVRDALRMVDSFLKWSRRHPDRAKSLDDFINDGLIAAAKRCEECLSYALGIEFRDRQEDYEDEMNEPASEMVEESIFSDEIPAEESETDISSDAPSYEEPSEESVAPRAVIDEEEMNMDLESHPDISSGEEASSMSDPESIVAESLVEAKESQPAEKKTSEPESFRDFSKEFHLGKPESMEDTDEDHEPPEDEGEVGTEHTEPDASPEEVTEESPAPESDEEMEDEDEDSFTWDDYEDALTPRVASPYGTSDEETDAEPEEEETWSPLDDPSVEDEPSSESPDMAEEDSTSEDHDESDEKQNRPEPPPPPPPQDDEDEDERRKRARRLFFGA